MDPPNCPDDFVVDLIPAGRRFLRIAMVTETYPPEVNGVAVTLAKLVDGLHEREHDIQLIRPRQGVDGQAIGETRFEEVLTRGLPIPRYPHLRMGLPSKRALVKMWSHQRPDVVHVATEGPLGWSALNAAMHLDIPVTSDFRTNFHAYSKHYGVGWLKRPIMGYLRKFHNRCRSTMVPTHALRRDLEAAGFRHLAVVSRGVDTERYSPAWRSLSLRQSWGVADDDLVVSYVGRLAAEKNLALAVQAFEAIRAVMPRARLLLVGDGPLRAELKGLLPGTIFAGQQRGQALAEHYASADIFLFPSVTETFGNVVTEAMASGLAIVSYDLAAAAEHIVNHASGIVIPADQEQAFVRAAVQLAQNRAEVRRLGLGARSKALTLDWQCVVSQFESLLLDASREGGVGRHAGATTRSFGVAAPAALAGIAARSSYAGSEDAMPGRARDAYATRIR